MKEEIDVRQYTTDEAVKNLALLEIHLRQYADKPVFCGNCSRKHLYILWGLSDEGMQFFPDSPDLWKRMGQWARNCLQGLGALTTARAIEMAEEARGFRKELVGEKKAEPMCIGPHCHLIGKDHTHLS